MDQGLIVGTQNGEVQLARVEAGEDGWWEHYLGGVFSEPKLYDEQVA